MTRFFQKFHSPVGHAAVICGEVVGGKKPSHASASLLAYRGALFVIRGAGEEQLAALVTRNSMVGTGLALKPGEAR